MQAPVFIARQAAIRPAVLVEPEAASIHGADLRDPKRCIPASGSRVVGGSEHQGSGNPDDVVALYQLWEVRVPSNPGANCDPKGREMQELVGLLLLPPVGTNHVYGGMCNIDDNRSPSGGCWNDGSMPRTAHCLIARPASPASMGCACTILRVPSLPQSDCPRRPSHPYSAHDRASQPHSVAALMSPATTACIGDDARGVPGGYRGPRFADVRERCARLPDHLRTRCAHQRPDHESGPVPACDSLPDAYGYTANEQNCSGVKGALFAGAARSSHTKTTTALIP